MTTTADTAIDAKREEWLVRGLRGMLQQLKAQYVHRMVTRQPHPGRIFINPEGYDLFIEALRIVNKRIGMPPPPDELYIFRGIEVRRGSPDGKRDHGEREPVHHASDVTHRLLTVGGRVRKPNQLQQAA